MTNGLNDNQKRHLLLTFQYMDNALSEALLLLAHAEAPSPFPRYVPDSLPIQRKVLSDYIARLRGVMVRILENLGISVPKPQISSLMAFKTSLLSARIAVVELGPKQMRGYGDLPNDAARELDVLIAQIMETLDRMNDYLARGAGQDLQARLERLEKTAHEVDETKVLEQVIAAHGLVELRLSLDAVIERLESSRFEVGVFGRVSSGKSSLLNYILQTDALPVGVTPVTAIPTRVVFGLRPLARIWFAEAEPITVELRELSQYATEQVNPNNAKHVSRIQVELPADRLKEGVTFVDTPGLGSLARYGEMESLAYLPRCDLGIVLVDASSTLIQEDASMVNALRQAGAEVMVLLTKADILTPEDRVSSARYLKNHLDISLGFDVPVHVVSVKGPDAELCNRWFAASLVPRLQEHKRLAEASLRRKVGLLREATIAALQRRLDKRSTSHTASAERWAAVEPRLNEALAELEAAQRERPAWPGLPEKIMDDAAQEIAVEWRKKGAVQVDAAAKIISGGSKQIVRIAGDIVKSLAQLRENLASALWSVAVVAGSRQDDAAEIPVPSGMPILDLSAGLPETPLRKPPLGFLLRGLAIRSARAQLDSQFGPRLASLLNQYAKQLTIWRLHVLTLMRRSFTARADFYRVQCEQTLDNSDLAAVERDLNRLRAFQSDPQPPLNPGAIIPDGSPDKRAD